MRQDHPDEGHARPVAAHESEVFIDGIPLRTLGVRAYRDQIAAVMQDDQLLSGTIADNICFFANSRDEDWMRECARMAGGV
jgi:ATP-binding cassette, subfamily B, bacterial CvaB/MchF/RaxB